MSGIAWNKITKVDLHIEIEKLNKFQNLKESICSNENSLINDYDD